MVLSDQGRVARCRRLEHRERLEMESRIRTQSLDDLLASTPRRKPTMTFDRQNSTIAPDPRQSLAQSPTQSSMQNPAPARDAKENHTVHNPRQNQRRIYISMRIPQARDEMKEILEAM